MDLIYNFLLDWWLLLAIVIGWVPLTVAAFMIVMNHRCEWKIFFHASNDKKAPAELTHFIEIADFEAAIDYVRQVLKHRYARVVCIKKTTDAEIISFSVERVDDFLVVQAKGKLPVSIDGLTSLVNPLANESN